MIKKTPCRHITHDEYTELLKDDYFISLSDDRSNFVGVYTIDGKWEGDTLYVWAKEEIFVDD